MFIPDVIVDIVLAYLYHPLPDEHDAVCHHISINMHDIYRGVDPFPVMMGTEWRHDCHPVRFMGTYINKPPLPHFGEHAVPIHTSCEVIVRKYAAFWEKVRRHIRHALTIPDGSDI